MRLTPDEIFAHKEQITAPAKEVLTHVHEAMVALPEFTLTDGTKAKTENYYSPQENADGELSAGVDVKFEDGSHLEVTSKVTGHGGRVKAERAAKGPKGRG
jgi:hypothetical protein